MPQNASRIILFFFLFWGNTLLFGQESSFEAFQNQWEELADEDKIPFLNEHFTAIPNTEKETFLSQAIFIAKDRKLVKEEGKLHMQMGINWYFLGDYPKALEHYQLALSLQESINDELGMGKTYNELAVFVRKQKDFAKSEEYLDLAFELCSAHKDYGCLSTNYNNRGALYADLGDWGKAEESYLKALENCQQIADTLGLGYVYGSLAEIASQGEQYSKAIQLLQQSTEYKRMSNDLFGVAINTTNTGELFFKQKKYRKAIQYFTESTQSTVVVDLQSWNHRYVSKCYAALGQTQKALDFLSRSYELKDSLISSKRIAELAEMETKYETEKKEQKIALQELDLKNQAEKFRTQMFSLGGISLALLLAGLLGFFLYRQKQVSFLQEKEMAFQQELLQNTLVVQEQEQKRIAKDLHDGIGQQLIGLKMAWQSFFTGVQSKIPEATSEVNQIKNILEETTVEVRSISHQMMPRALQELGLLAALADLIDKSFPKKSIQCEFDHHGIKDRFSENIEIQSYRVVQELLSNILKHAQATEVAVQIYKTKQQLVIIVEDNGIGFDTQNQKSKGHGLLNITSRLISINGEIDVESKVGKGTLNTIKIQLP